MAEPSGEVQELIDAARYGDLEDVAVALDSKTPVNGTDELGRTGLHMACANGHADVVRLLISSGADVTLANAEGNTALHWSCLNGHVEIIRLLVVAGASPSALNSHEKTPIDEALSHMQRDEILVAINLHASTGGGGGNADDEGFSFEVSEEADGGGFPQKPR